MQFTSVVSGASLLTLLIATILAFVFGAPAGTLAKNAGNFTPKDGQIAFQSVDRNVACLIYSQYRLRASCVSLDRSRKYPPQYYGEIARNGKVRICTVAHLSLYEACYQNFPPGPALPYGQHIEYAGVRCTSSRNGITCIKLTKPRKGHGFRVSKDKAARVKRRLEPKRLTIPPPAARLSTVPPQSRLRSKSCGPIRADGRTVRFARKGRVSCRTAKSVYLRYLRKAKRGECEGNGCFTKVRGGWYCVRNISVPLEEETGEIANCYKRRGASFRVIELRRSGRSASHFAPANRYTRDASRTRRTSKALLWSAPGGKITCGIANHVGGGPLQLLCAARSIPPPKHADPTIGDPGFVYLKAHQRPQLARLSQYSWQKGRNYGESNKATALRSGTRWGAPGLAVTCAIRKRAVRCRNGAGHGFIIRRGSYRGF